MSTLDEGQVLRDTYTVERRLGEGTFGEVYRVWHRFLGRQAMKVLKSFGRSAAEIAEALAEAAILHRLEHPNLARVYEANVIDTLRGPCAFYTMEYVAGGSLESYLEFQPGRVLPVDASVEIGCQVLSALATAHACEPPVVHRDLKPGNVLLGIGKDGRMRAILSDFGLAAHVNPRTRFAESAGNLAFLAPETRRPLAGCSTRSDVWSMGATLYVMLTGQMPYPRPPDDDYRRPRQFETLVPASRFNVRVDADLDAIVARSLAINARDRHADAGEMLEELEKWRAARPGRAEVRLTPAPPRESERPAHHDHAPGVQTPSAATNEQYANELAAEAVRLARDHGRLADAVQLLERACSLDSTLSRNYQDLLNLWKRGVAM